MLNIPAKEVDKLQVQKQLGIGELTSLLDIANLVGNATVQNMNSKGGPRSVWFWTTRLSKLCENF